ncbi:MAG: tyrosine-type recombinase/integrase [Myxococcota bacterium]
MRTQRRREVRDGTFEEGLKSKRVTVGEAIECWLDAREGQVRTVRDDRTRMEMVASILGHDRALREVQAVHLLTLLNELRTRDSARGHSYAESTIINIWGNVATFFADMEQQGLVEQNPCKRLRRGQLPKKPKRSQIQRGYFPPAAVQALISDPTIPLYRRVGYALQVFTGMRFSEAAGIRWCDYYPDREPLGHIRLTQQWHDKQRAYTALKGKRGEPGPPRDIPVHPVLASMLDVWRKEGFPKYFLRPPRPEDPIVPSLRGPAQRRTLRNGLHRLKQDCGKLKVAPIGGVKSTVTQHELRNTFITLAIAGGASEPWVRRISHNSSGDVLAGYTVNDWDAMCRAVECIPVPLAPVGGSVTTAAPQGTANGHREATSAQATEDECERASLPGGRDPIAELGIDPEVLASILALLAEDAQSLGFQGENWRGGRDSNTSAGTVSIGTNRI